MRKSILILGHNYVSHFVDIYNQYSKLFDREKYEVTIGYLTGIYDEEVKNRTLSDHVIFFNLPKKHIRYLKIIAIKKLLQLCGEKRFEMIICHRYKPSYIMLWTSLFYKIPTLIFIMHELKTMSSWGRRCLIAMLARKNMYFAGVSNAVRDDMRKDLWCVPKKRIITLYNAIDVTQKEQDLLSREAARKMLQIPTDAFLFGNLARLVPNKDHHTLIEAFSRVKSKYPHAKLIIMGNGELESSLKAKVAFRYLTEDILFTGFVPDGFRYMRAFDCFVLSSIQEAFGRVLIEAMIAKLPIIATAVHGIPEVLGEIGTLVKPQDIEALSQAMEKMMQLTHHERQTFGKKAYQHVLAHFSIPAFYHYFWNIQ